MTDDQSDARSEKSRRSFVKYGALTSGALALGSPLSGTALAQEGNETAGDDGTDGGPPPGEALMFNDEFRPGAQFRAISGAVSQTPELASGAEEILGEYDAFIVEYLLTGERVLLFVSSDAGVEQGQAYEFTDSLGVVEEEPTGDGIISVEFASVAEEDLVVDPDFSIDDLATVEGGGKALVRADNMFPGALVRIVSGVVEWTPPPDVAGSDILSEYNTRHARYLNTGDEFLIYPARSAEITDGAVYALREEFDITAPEGNLVTVELDRIDEDELADGLLD